LIYHFGSKEGLITAVMDEVRDRIQKSFARLLANPARGAEGLMSAFWAWAIHPKNVSSDHLFFAEVWKYFLLGTPVSDYNIFAGEGNPRWKRWHSIPGSIS
jgi:AcrR family transcriptional regulator